MNLKQMKTQHSFPPSSLQYVSTFISNRNVMNIVNSKFCERDLKDKPIYYGSNNCVGANSS